MSFIDQILAEAESELLKEANDDQGAPDTASNQEQGGGDILTTAQAFLQKVEQFKAALGQNAAGVDPNAQVAQDPNAQQSSVADPNAQIQDPNAQVVAPAATSGNSPITIVRPDGTQIKLASLAKLASLRGSNLFKEV
jgi:hypothetical protein